MTAASIGDLDGVRTYIGFLGEQESHGWTALILAARGNHLECLRELFAERKLVDNEKKTALMHAASAGHVEIVEALSDEQGLEDMYGWTALMYATRKGNISCLNLLRDEATKRSHLPHLGVGAGATALIIAASYGHTAALDILGAAETSICDVDGHDIEWYAVSQDAQEFLEKVDAGLTLRPESNVEGISRDTLLPPPLPPPSKEPSQGSSKASAPKKHVTTLLEAIKEDDRLAFREFVRQRQPAQDECDENGMTPLMHAARLGRDFYVQYLRPDGLRKRDKEGWTALMHAVDANQQSTMMLLLGECDIPINGEPIQSYATSRNCALASTLSGLLSRNKGLTLPDKLSGYTATYRMSSDQHEEKWYAYDRYPHNHLIQKFTFNDLDAYTRAAERIPRLERFRHENILGYSEVAFSESDSAVYYVLDFYAGTLKDQIDDRFKAKETFSDDEIWRFIYYIAKGLDFLEEKGRIVHRNLTPSSIYVDKFWRFCIGEMTIARHLDGGQNLMSRCGNDELYHAPELLNKESCDNKIDVWSLGVMAYYMCAGDLPFKNVVEVLNSNPPMLVNRNEDLIRLIMRMLARDPKERPKPFDIVDEIEDSGNISPDM